jgi:hypothetical protein
MSQLTIEQYLMGRDVADPIDEEQRLNALHLLSRVNELLEQFYSENPHVAKRTITSGYRPSSINAKVGGAKKSKHMLCAAVDLSDSDRKLSEWLKNTDILVKYDLYMEDKASTPTWVHLQIIPPGSKNRVFKP